MTQNLELRVLTGLHQGARCKAQDGALIGSHVGCDVVLCDDGIAHEAVRLWFDEAGWRLSAHDNPTDTTPALPFGQPFAIGPIHLTLAPAIDPWPDPAELAAMLRSAEESERDAGDANQALDEPAREEMDAAMAAEQDAHTPRPGPDDDLRENALRFRPAPRRKAAGLRWVFGGVLIMIVFGGAASFSPAGVQSSPHVTTGPIADEETLLRTRQLLRNLGFSDRVRASLSSDQEVLVTGWVRDEADHDQLATALSAIWPLPTLQVDDQRQVATRIAAQAEGLDVLIALEYPGPGRVTVRGIAASEEVRAQAVERWRTNSDAVPRITATLMLADQVDQAFKEAVATAGLPQVPSHWKDKALRLAPQKLDPTQHARLKSVVDTLNATYMNALLLNDEARPEAVAAPIPFRIHSVVSGKQPWVMLEDGTRIVVGGTHGAYRLKSIEDSSVVFEGPTVAVIPR